MDEKTDTEMLEWVRQNLSDLYVSSSYGPYDNPDEALIYEQDVKRILFAYEQKERLERLLIWKDGTGFERIQPDYQALERAISEEAVATNESAFRLLAYQAKRLDSARLSLSSIKFIVDVNAKGEHPGRFHPSSLQTILNIVAREVKPTLAERAAMAAELRRQADELEGDGDGRG
ncbi:MAG: hypothetical protein MUF38_14835 [Anaerolineae bacterium]|jgi:hypothetical protein|nr:hypothetical protein [Anaerolineae bacterium]